MANKIPKISTSVVPPQDSQRDIGTPLVGFSQIFRQNFLESKRSRLRCILLHQPPLAGRRRQKGAEIKTLCEISRAPAPPRPGGIYRAEGGACSRGAVSGTLPDFRIPNFQNFHRFLPLTIGPKPSEKSIWQGPRASGGIFHESLLAFSVKAKPPKEGGPLRGHLFKIEK